MNAGGTMRLGAPASASATNRSSGIHAVGVRFRMRRPRSAFGLAVSILAGFLNRRQQDAIEYPREENRVLRELLGGRLSFYYRRAA